MNIVILGREALGTCDLTNKKETEVWLLKVGDGETQRIATQRLLEILRFSSQAGIAQNSSAPTIPAKK